jgi:hypothetical protein
MADQPTADRLLTQADDVLDRLRLRPTPAPPCSPPSAS